MLLTEMLIVKVLANIKIHLSVGASGPIWLQGLGHLISHIFKLQFEVYTPSPTVVAVIAFFLSLEVSSSYFTLE